METVRGPPSTRGEATRVVVKGRPGHEPSAGQRQAALRPLLTSARHECAKKPAGWQRSRGSLPGSRPHQAASSSSHRGSETGGCAPRVSRPAPAPTSIVQDPCPCPWIMSLTVCSHSKHLRCSRRPYARLYSCPTPSSTQPSSTRVSSRGQAVARPETSSVDGKKPHRTISLWRGIPQAATK